MPEQLFDLVICALLVVTIGHLFVVQRRLAAFRAERDRLQAFVTALDLTVERAEAAIRKLKQVQGVGAEPPAGQKKQVLRPRSPEELLEAAGGAGGNRQRRPATATAQPPMDDAKGGLAALLKSVAGRD